MPGVHGQRIHGASWVVSEAEIIGEDAARQAEWAGERILGNERVKRRPDGSAG
jgi:hypothetical protein